MLHFIRRHIDRIMEFCTGPNADRVTHVDYYRLADDPANVCVYLGMSLVEKTVGSLAQGALKFYRQPPSIA